MFLSQFNNPVFTADISNAVVKGLMCAGFGDAFEHLLLVKIALIISNEIVMHFVTKF